MSSIDDADEHSMRELARDPDHPARALDVIMQIHRAKDPPELLDRLVHATTAIGGAASLYSVAIPEAGNDASSFSLFACHPGFAYNQQRLGPLLHHPWFRFARTHSTPGTDHTIHIQQQSDAEAIELARQYGFTSCLIVPTAGGADLARLEILCIGSDREAAFEGDDARLIRTLARALAAELHDWVTRHLSDTLKQTARLHKTDIELLRLEWEGLGTKAISAQTGMSPAAVNSRFQRLNVRLECANRKDAARRAAEYGLLESTKG